MYDDALRFRDHYVERIWGGRKLASALGKDLPEGAAIGEDWLISDHSSAQSVVAEGPHAGMTLRALIERDARAILGSHAQLTVHGRFPLLLKLLDANDVLSVQVHPDDAAAAELGEPDVGKTEMWHVLQAEPGSALYCGLRSGVDAGRLRDAIETNTLEELLVQFPVDPETSVFVPAGTVHAIGAGIVLAEIQQNSDLTYRLYDWGRVQADGTPRALHVDKSLVATKFAEGRQGPATTLTYPFDGGVCEVIAACRHFAAERVAVGGGSVLRESGGRSFHIVLGKTGVLAVTVPPNGQPHPVHPGEAVLVPGAAHAYALEGEGSALCYYVPDLDADIRRPLADAGHPAAAIEALGLASV